MNIKAIKTTGISFALATAFLVTAGSASSSNAFAQDGRWRNRDRDGWQDNRRERFEERRGYSDRLNRGCDDTRNHRSFDSRNSERFRDGNGAYREGFRGRYNDRRRISQGYFDRWGNFHRY